MVSAETSFFVSGWSCLNDLCSTGFFFSVRITSRFSLTGTASFLTSAVGGLVLLPLVLSVGLALGSACLLLAAPGCARAGMARRPASRMPAPNSRAFPAEMWWVIGALLFDGVARGEWPAGRADRRRRAGFSVAP